MSAVISGGLIISLFILVAMLISSTFLTTSDTQATSLKEISKLRIDQIGGDISITSTIAANSGDGTNVTLAVNNPGSIGYGDFSQVDVVIDYTNTTGDQEVRRLTYVCRQLCGNSADPGDNQWTVTSLVPDGYSPKMWNPDEVANMTLNSFPRSRVGRQER